MKIIAKNKRAYHEYGIEDTYSAGIILQWHEVKSIKTQSVNITDASASIMDGALWLYGMDVPFYKKSSPVIIPHYDPKRKRKLLINQKELAKISAATDRKGMTLVPLEVFVTIHWLIKIKLWLGKLLRKVEKKQILKEKDVERQMKKEIKKLMN